MVERAARDEEEGIAFGVAGGPILAGETGQAGRSARCLRFDPALDTGRLTRLIRVEETA